MGGTTEDGRTYRTARPWWPKLLAAAGMVTFVVVVWSLMRQSSREPMYHGRGLTLWLRTYASSSSSGRHSREWNEADDAVRHMGINCIPTLLHMLRQKDTNVKHWLVTIAQKQKLVKFHFVPAAVRNVEASRAFIVLGDLARDAVPALVQMHRDNVSVESQSAIEDALAWIGPGAKPMPSATVATSALTCAIWGASKIRCLAAWLRLTSASCHMPTAPCDHQNGRLAGSAKS